MEKLRKCYPRWNFFNGIIIFLLLSLCNTLFKVKNSVIKYKNTGIKMNHTFMLAFVSICIKKIWLIDIRNWLKFFYFIIHAKFYSKDKC